MRYCLLFFRFLCPFFKKKKKAHHEILAKACGLVNCVPFESFNAISQMRSICVNILRNVTVQFKCRYKCLQFTLFYRREFSALIPGVCMLFFIRFVDGFKMSCRMYLQAFCFNWTRIFTYSFNNARNTQTKCNEAYWEWETAIEWSKEREKRIKKQQHQQKQQ